MDKLFTPKGTQFHKWTTLEDCNGIGNRTVLCRCECGLEKQVYIKHLLNEKSRSCKSCASKTTGRITEKTIGQWEILKEVPSNRGRKYLCRCRCGLETVVSYNALTQGKANGCNSCNRREDLDIIGKHFGNWEVVRDVYRTSPRRVLCKCKCGKEQEVILANLLADQTHGCRSCSKKKVAVTETAKPIPLRTNIEPLSKHMGGSNQDRVG